MYPSSTVFRRQDPANRFPVLPAAFLTQYETRRGEIDSVSFPGKAYVRKGFGRNPAGHPKFSRRQIFLSCARAYAAAIQNKKQENQPPSYYIFMKSLCALRQISHKTGKNLHYFYMYPKNSASKPFFYHQNSMPPQISRFCFVIFSL